MGVDTPLLKGIVDSADPEARMAAAAVTNAGKVIGPDRVAEPVVEAVRANTSSADVSRDRHIGCHRGRARPIASSTELFLGQGPDQEAVGDYGGTQGGEQRREDRELRPVRVHGHEVGLLSFQGGDDVIAKVVPDQGD